MMLSHIECAENYFDECEGKGFSRPGPLPKIKRYLIDICKEDSTIRAGKPKDANALTYLYKPMLLLTLLLLLQNF